MYAEQLLIDTATRAAATTIENASPKILSAIGTRLNKELIKLRVQFTKTFQNHLKNSFARSLKIKTVTSRDQPVFLEDIYVAITLATNDESGLVDLTADPSRTLGARYILSGTGGAGKTVLMKHLINISSENKLGLIPIYIELRNLQFDASDKFEDNIFKELELNGADESMEMFKIALEEGLFSFYLDGFDEIHPEESSRALEQIKRFSERYENNSILITTRPKTGVARLRLFTVFHVEPLHKSATLELVRKTEFDEITKTKFGNYILDVEVSDSHFRSRQAGAD